MRRHINQKKEKKNDKTTQNEHSKKADDVVDELQVPTVRIYRIRSAN